MKLTALAAFAAVCGCSVHPLPDRVTGGLETHAIVQKIRCETQDAVLNIYQGNASTKGLYERKGLVRFKDGFDIERRKKYDLAIANLKEAREGFKVLEAEERRLKDRRSELETRITLNELTKEKGLDDIRRSSATASQQADGVRKVRESFKVKRDKLTSKVLQFRIDSFSYNSRAAASKRLIERQEKQVGSEYEELLKFLSHQLTLQVRFNIVEKNTGKVDGSFKIPVPLGTVTIDPAAGDERERVGERIIKITADFEDLLREEQGGRSNKKNCRDPGLVHDGGHASRYPIVGRIGLAEVIEQYLQVSEQAAFQKGTDTFTDKLQFKTTVGAGVKPKITIAQVTGHSFTGNFELSGSRIDLHEVYVGLYREKAEKATGAETDKVVRVQILRDPEF